MVPGCGTAFAPNSGGALTTLTLSALGIGEDETYFEAEFANDLLSQASFVDLSSEPHAIQGTINAIDDVDVYDLGPVEPGDRISVVMTSDEFFTGAIALFDETGAALLVNDHRNVYLGRTQPFIDVVARRHSAACYVAAASTPGFTSLGNYTLVAEKQVGVPLPAAQPDEILMVFSGGTTVRIGGRPTVQVPQFDAIGISDSLAGRSAEIIEYVLEYVREDFEGFNVTIFSTSEGDAFNGEMTRVLFGSYDAALLGIAEGVDEFNSTKGQDAIVFTDTFSAFAVLKPSVRQIARAIANVASHEIGHLMGLVHTSDPDDIMDVTASLRDLLDDQTFRKAPLLDDVFPIGYQDSTQSLLDAVGGDPLMAMARKADEALTAAERRSKAPGIPARESLRLSTCDACLRGGR
jgi:hypothetical protein